jgi:hypothetical protein
MLLAGAESAVAKYNAVAVVNMIHTIDLFCLLLMRKEKFGSSTYLHASNNTELKYYNECIENILV